MNIATGTIAFLVLVPALFAVLMLLVRGDKGRSILAVIGALVIACGSIFCVVQTLGACSAGTQYYVVSAGVSKAISYIALVIDVILGLYIICKGIKQKKYIAPVLALCQTILIVWFELTCAEEIHVAQALYLDNLTLVMILVIGIIGSGICVYGLGYMRDYQKHAEGKDRRPVFFALMFVFLAAMFGIVVSNNMAWMLCAWEITTVCSFALIGYTRTQEAINNSFRQIILNLIGGLAFAIALVWVAKCYGTLEFDQFLSITEKFAAGGYSILTVMPLLLLALAGFTKAAQMPFQSWLLGAMVAPTPTSALLHSSTMVKAGVFLLIKLAPCFGMNMPGMLVMLVGGVTFLFCAFAAISQSNAKRVLAYSTISNLGLITLCAGIGTAEATWAAIFLLVFHAAAKSLLFLCVGTAEHHVGSRDIESFDQLFERMPMLARLMAIGILGMFIAPLGMLISKWAALESIASTGNVVLILILVFGSAATFMFWSKWLGKILAVAHNNDEDVEVTVYKSEWASMGLMTVLTVGCCIGFVLLSQTFVEPYLTLTFGEGTAAIAYSSLWIMAVISLVIAAIFLLFKGNTKKRVVPVYMAGAGMDLNARTYRDSLGNEAHASQRNWYMDSIFGEKKMTLIGCAIALTLLGGFFGYQLMETAQDDNKATITSIAALQSAYAEAQDEESGNALEEYETISSTLSMYGVNIDMSTFAKAKVLYTGSAWEKAQTGLEMYCYYYASYGSTYEQYAKSYKKMGINNEEELMDQLLVELMASMTGEE